MDRWIAHSWLCAGTILSSHCFSAFASTGASAQAKPAYYDHHRLGGGEVQRPRRRVFGFPQDQRWNDVEALPAALLQGTFEPGCRIAWPWPSFYHDGRTGLRTLARRSFKALVEADFRSIMVGRARLSRFWCLFYEDAFTVHMYVCVVAFHSILLLRS